MAAVWAMLAVGPLAACGQTLGTQLPDSSKTPPRTQVAEERQKAAKAMQELNQKKDAYREEAIKEIEQAR